MGNLSLSVVIPAWNEETTIGATLDELSTYFGSTGLGYELLVVDDGSTDRTSARVRDAMTRDGSVRLIRMEGNAGKGAALRKGVAEARGEVIAFTDADLPYRIQNLGDAIALVQSGSTDIAIGARDLPSSERDSSYPWLRRFMGRSFSFVVRALLVPGIADTQCGLKAFARDAARSLFADSKIDGFGFDFEILFLARRYGLRIERIPVSMSHRHESKVRLVRDSWRMLIDVFRVRHNARRKAYRLPRRCPVCFTREVGTRTQIRGWVVRECYRCRCRYLARFPSEEEIEALYGADYFSSSSDRECGYASRELDEASRRTIEARLSRVRRVLAPRSRLLELGSGNGIFGELASREFDYVGIDPSEEGCNRARSRGLEVFRATLDDFVNTGPPFDAITLFHVFEHLPDPHAALARIDDLLKPDGLLFLITPDTESLLCALSGDGWVSYKFPEHFILYSRTALIDLFEQSGFEILSAQSDSEYCDHRFLRSRLETLHPWLAGIARVFLRFLPDPVAVDSGSIRIVARKRLGPTLIPRPIRAAQPTHAR